MLTLPPTRRRKAARWYALEILRPGGPKRYRRVDSSPTPLARHPLAHEARELAAIRSGIRVHVAYSRPRLTDEVGIDYDSEGRVDGALLASLIGDGDAHYFLCGPTRFMADLQTELERRNIPAEHIHTESFGPVG